MCVCVYTHTTTRGIECKDKPNIKDMNEMCYGVTGGIGEAKGSPLQGKRLLNASPSPSVPQNSPCSSRVQVMGPRLIQHPGITLPPSRAEGIPRPSIVAKEIPSLHPGSREYSIQNTGYQRMLLRPFEPREYPLPPSRVQRILYPQYWVPQKAPLSI